MEKIFVIGLDGATLPLIRKWGAEGALPNLARLISGGTWGRLKSVPNMNSAPAWTSFATGMNPGKHGIFYFYDRVEGTYGIRYINGGDCKADHIWQIIGKACRKVGVINVPMTYPAREVNGFLIAGMDAPGIKSKRFTFPEKIKAELLCAVPYYVIEPGITGYIKNGDLGNAISKAMESIDARTEAVLHFASNHPWDFFMVVYREMDVIQHYFWKHMDDISSGIATDDTKFYGDTIRNIYMKLDNEIGKLLSVMPENTVKIIMSDHGGAPAEGAVPMMNRFFEHMGLLEFRQKEKGIKRKIVEKALSVVQRRTSRVTKEMLLRLFPSIREKIEASSYFDGINWGKTVAYTDGSRIEIWLNLAGREPEGTVKKAEYDTVCDEIKRKLLSWRDPVTKKCVVKEVFKKEEAYKGEYTANAPDMLVQFNEDVIVKGIAIEDENGNVRVIENFGRNTGGLVNGAHGDNGIFILNGPGIKKGVELEGIEIIDLAPTILYLMDLEIPSDMDGRIILDAIEDSGKLTRTIKHDSSSARKPDWPPEQSYTEEDMKVIRDRLKGLGYIE